MRQSGQAVAAPPRSRRAGADRRAAERYGLINDTQFGEFPAERELSSWDITKLKGPIADTDDKQAIARGRVSSSGRDEDKLVDYRLPVGRDVVSHARLPRRRGLGGQSDTQMEASEPRRPPGSNELSAPSKWP